MDIETVVQIGTFLLFVVVVYGILKRKKLRDILTRNAKKGYGRHKDGEDNEEDDD